MLPIFIPMKLIKNSFIASLFAVISINHSIVLSQPSSQLSSIKSIKLVQASQEETELVTRMAKQVSVKCVEAGLAKKYPNDKVKKLMIICESVFKYNISSLRNGKIKLPPLSDQKPSNMAGDIAKVLFEDETNKKFQIFLLKNIGKDKGNELAYLTLFGAASTFLQGDRGIDMGL
jgi:hypothetical protein